MEEKETKATTASNRKKAPEKSEATLLKEKLAQTEKEKSEMYELMKSMQEQIDAVKNQSPQVIVQAPTGVSDTPCEIGCRLFCGATLSSPSGDVSISVKCGEEVEVTVREINEVFRSEFGFKKLFERGVLYFVDPEMYKHFKIRNSIDLSEATLIEKLTEANYNDMIEFLAKVTEDRKLDMVCHTICYNAATLFASGKLGDWSYANRNNFESYMKVKIDEIIQSINRSKELGIN